MTPAEALRTYGYLALFVGSTLEGEGVTFLGGIASRNGWLSWPLALLVGCFGTWAATQVWFVAGRVMGQRVLERRPAMAEKVARANAMLEKRETLVCVGYRFLYGLRTVTPFAIGMSRVSAVKFITLDALTWVVWLGTVSTVGYVFGEVARPWLEAAMASQKVLLGVFVVVVAVVVVRTLWKRRQAPKGTDTPDTGP